MTPERIAELRELCESQPPGEWEWDYGVSLRTAWGLLDGTGKHILRFKGPNDIEVCPDADVVMEFAAAARTALPELLDEIERLRDLLDTVGRWIDNYCGDGWGSVTVGEAMRFAAQIRTALKGEPPAPESS